MAIWTLAKKELRLLVRDRRAALLLVAMPLLFILVLGLLLGESFGQKPDDRLRVSIVDLDQGYAVQEATACVAWMPCLPAMNGAVDGSAFAAVALASANRTGRFPHGTWSKVVERDLAETAGIRLEIIASKEEAQRLVDDHRRAAVLILKPIFSERVAQCSFLVEGINPFHRDGVYLDEPGKPPLLGAELLKTRNKAARQPSSSRWRR
jgi:hypothetical protein